MAETAAKIGRYELIRRLAVGGMAELFLARKSGIEGFQKLVVVKRILPQLAVNEEFVKMFIDEARLAAQLHHPNIGQVYDIGRDTRSFFFVMEYIEGKDLRSVTKAARTSGGLPIEHAIAIMGEVAAGLHYAHERLDLEGRSMRIVHRDVSPANVIVTYDGDVKLVDFGIAKARVRQTETRVGTLKGKISYMSPEQCRGEAIDRRSDIFSAGILLYELTVGAKLFKAASEYTLLQSVATADVNPPSRVIPGYPPGLEKIVMRALSRNPSDRQQTAEELQSDLEDFALENGITLSSVKLRRYMRGLFPQAIPARAPTELAGEEPAFADDEAGREELGETMPRLEPLAARPASDLGDLGTLLPRENARQDTPVMIIAQSAMEPRSMVQFPLGAPNMAPIGANVAVGTGTTSTVKRRLPQAQLVPEWKRIAIIAAAITVVAGGLTAAITWTMRSSVETPRAVAAPAPAPAPATAETPVATVAAAAPVLVPAVAAPTVELLPAAPIDPEVEPSPALAPAADADDPEPAPPALADPGVLTAHRSHAHAPARKHDDTAAGTAAPATDDPPATTTPPETPDL